jgi:hypothetical protein
MIVGGDAKGGDEPTKSKLLASFTERMQKLKTKNAAHFIAEPGWDLSYAAKACAKPKAGNVYYDGVLVVTLVSSSYWVTHRIFQQAHSSAVDASVWYAQCKVDDSTDIAYVWGEPLAYEVGSDSVTNLAPLTLLLPLVAVYQAVSPTRAVETDTVAAPTTTKTTITANGSGSNVGSLAGTLVGASLNYGNTLNPTTNDLPTWFAVNQLTGRLAANTGCTLDTQTWTHAVPLPPMDPGNTPAPFCPTASSPH